MDAATQPVIKALLVRMQKRLQQALPIANAAVECADAGNLRKAVKLMMNVEPLAHDVNDHLKCALALCHLEDDDNSVRDIDFDD